MADQVVDVLLRARMEANEAVSGVNQIQKALQGLTLPKGLSNDLEKEFSKLGPLLKDYQKQLNKGFSNKKDLQNFNALKEQIGDTFGSIKTLVNQANSQEIKLKVDTQAIDQLQNKIISKTEALNKAFSQVFTKTANPTNIAEQLNKVLESTTKASSIKGMVGGARNLFDSKEYVAYNAEIDKIKNKILSLKTTKMDFAQALGIKDAEKDIADVEQKITNFFNKLKINDSKAQGIELLKKELQELGVQAEGLDLSSKIKGEDEIRNIGSALDQVQQNFHETGNAADEAASGILSMKDQVGQLQQSTQYFFSLRNMINLFRRGVQDAVQSVKELDAAMTETAVVTDFKVSDMWKMLPQYTKTANELGATTQGAYETMTLYYQQGLNQQQAFELGAETMKMARIAGLDYAETTDMMTAALRGFNMELNETSAKRVNDVYSELAAVTASDTEELGTAMQRTASIAHSAGMSFEGATAFLAQAIETTREPAENIGTAMKTIVARFQEMKENPLEISEVDGEEVNYNKVDAALQSIGVSLKDANGQFRELDKVFLDISKRWDGLSQTQQRYIATVAAGSRQQSRFIAMMSNYDRTVELMTAANNSAGASDEQFGKTMDSLESKLNKLHNAWQQFTMGIANNTFIKGAVDGMTLFLNTTNSIIDALSVGSSTIKSFLSIFAAFTGLKMLGRIANAAIGGLGGLIDPQSSIKEGFFSGAIGHKQSNNAAQAKMISDPIVNAINRLYQAQTGKTITKDSQTNATADYKAFREANTGLRGHLSQLKAGEEFSLGTAYQKIHKLDNKQQKAILQQLPGLSMSLETSGIKLNTKGLTKTSQDLLNAFSQEINQGLKNKTLDSQAVLKMFGSANEFKKAMATRGDDYAQAASEVLGNSFDRVSYREDLAQKLLNIDKFKNMKSNDFENYLDQAVEKRAKRADMAGLEDFSKLASSTQAHGAAVANAFGKVGTSATMAGQGVAQLGMQLTQLGMTNVGGVITDLGYRISSLGMIASSVGGLIGQVLKAGEGSFGGGMLGIINAHPVIAALSAITIAATTAITILHKMKQEAKEAAEEVQKNYNDTIKDTNDKIESLEASKDIFNKLSKGVDKYGHNIGLTTEEYEEYLNISKTLAETSPSLIRGYDAEGRALVANGQAIDDLIKKQKNLQESARQNYINAGALDTTIKGIKAGDNYKLAVNTSELTKMDLAGKSGFYNLPFFNKQVKTLQKSLNKLNSKQVKELNKQIAQLTGQKIDLGNLTKDGVRALATNYSDINRIVEENGKDLDDKTRENIQKAFSGLGEDYNTFLEDLQPLTNQISEYLNSKGMSALGLGISEEFVGGFNKGLENLAMDATIEGWGGSRLQREAENYANQFKKLTSENSTYSRTLEQVDRIQQDYLKHVGEPDAVDNYNSSIQNQINTLSQLADQYENSGAAGKAFAEMCRQAAADAQNFTEYGIASLAEGLNTLSSEFTYARGAEERFKEATKGGDYYTAAEQYKSIIDTVMDEKNNAGQGSLTAWRGATELLGTDFVDSAKNWNTVANQIKRITPMFEDGANGVLAFNDYLVEAWETAGNGGKVLSKLGDVVQGEFGKDFKFNFENINDHLKEFSEELGISEGALAALIDKSRQWVPWDISDPGMIMSALRTSDTSMEGKGGKLYTSESAFREEAYAHEIVGDNYKTTKGNLEREQNVDFLTVDKLVSKRDNGQVYANEVLKDIGISADQQNNTLANAVQAYSKMGFGLEDIQKILTTDGVTLQEGKVDASQVEEAYNEQEFAQENPTVAGIANDTGAIASNTSAMLAAMGILSKDAENNIKQATDSKHLRDVENTFKTDIRNAQTTKDHENARNKVQMEIEGIDSSIALLEKGKEQLAEGSAEYNKYEGYIEELNNARERLQKTLNDDNKSFEEKKNAIAETLSNIGANANDQEWINANALDIDAALNNVNWREGVNSLKALAQEGDLSYQSLFNLAQQFQSLHETDLSNLTYGELSDLYTSLGLANSESKSLYMSLHGLSSEQTQILVNTNISGVEKVNEFINTLAETPEQKTIIVEAAAKIANGDKASAKKSLMEQLGFSEDKAEKVTQKIEIAVETGSISGADITSVLNSLPDNKNITFTGDASGLVSAANEATTATGEVPDSTNTSFRGNSSGVVGAASTGKDAIAGVPSTHLTNILGNASNAIGASGAATSSINGIPLTHHTSINATDNASSKANAVASALNAIPSVVSTTIKTIKETVTTGHARGRNYSIPAHQTPTFGSAAGGFNGTKQSKREITSLVGEEGFEVAYIPSEGRSMILGANGPEFVSFPTDTVIYPHKQSLDIIRRGKKSAPTMDAYASGRSGGLRSSVIKYQSSSNSGSSKGSSGGSNKSSSKSAAKAVTSAANGVKQVTGYVSVWWENMSRRVDATQRKIDKSLSTFEKQTKDFGTSRKAIESTISGYKKNLKTQISLSNTEIQRAKTELKHLEKGTDKFFSREEISYQVKTKKDGKVSDETKKMMVDLNKFISYNKQYDTYEISQEAVKKVGRQNKSQAEAIKQAAEKAINDRTSKLKTAEDNLKKAQDALAKLADDVYETFYNWEKSINQVYLLSHRLEEISKKLSIAGNKSNLELAKMEAGVTTAAQSFRRLQQALQTERDSLLLQAQASQKNIDATRAEFQNSMTLMPYIKNLSANPDSVAAKNDYLAAKQAFDLLKKANLNGSNFNYTDALEALNTDKNVTKDEYDAIKKVIDGIFDKQTAYLDTIDSAYKNIASIYEKMEEYQSFIADFETDLLSGLEKQAEDEIKHLEALSSAIAKAYKDILDEVKRKLDERRKREDNAKTESNISRKQQRLAALRADTSGGHQVEIAQLEQEIAEAQQSYQRTLEDQLIDKLQQQGDEAEKQRQRQIQLLEIQKDIASETGTNIEEVRKWLENPQKYYNDIRNAWLSNKGYEDSTPGEQKQLREQFEADWAKYQSYGAELPNLQTEANKTLSNIESTVNKIAENSSAIDIKSLSTTEMKSAGVTAKALKIAGYSNQSIINAGYNKSQLADVGITAKTLADNKINATTARKAGFNATELKKAGYKAEDLKAGGYTAAQMRSAGYSVKQLKSAGYKALDIAKTGYSAKDLKAGGVDTKALASEGISNINQAIASGINKTVAAGLYGATAAMTQANMSGKATQSATGASLQTLQKVVNISTTDEAIQTDLAGVKTSIDINGKKKGGVVSGTVTSDGRYVYANSGSTIYGQAINTKTGNTTGKISKVSIGSLTTQHFKSNKQEATEALVYAITHQAWGSKINKNFKSLVTAAGIGGNSYKLGAKGHNWWASIGTDGLIYQNVANGVATWNPATGKTGLSKYNKANFLKIAKRNNGPSREYAQVLIDKKAYTQAQLKKLGVKQFATGGLADFTGPAWLDGTKSKPELVLNSADTKNFLVLKDILSQALRSTNSINNSYGGDATYEININVDHINNDYDVDKIAERVKRNIVKDSSYRNVTQVRKFR